MMKEQAERQIVDPTGRPARRVPDERCPQCGAGPNQRVKSGMGDAHPVCQRCGYEWHEEQWHV